MRKLKNIGYHPNGFVNTGVIYHGNEGPNSNQMPGRKRPSANIKFGYPPARPRPRCVPPMKCIDPEPLFQTSGYKSPKPVKYVTVNQNTPTTKNPKLIKQVVVRTPVKTPVRVPVKTPPFGPVKTTTTVTPGTKTKVQLVTDKIKGVTPKNMKKHITSSNVKKAGIALALLIAFGVGRMSKSKSK